VAKKASIPKCRAEARRYETPSRGGRCVFGKMVAKGRRSEGRDLRYAAFKGLRKGPAATESNRVYPPACASAREPVAGGSWSGLRELPPGACAISNVTRR
jgi:hypothetical protein